jgi:hypothetical protein
MASPIFKNFHKHSVSWSDTNQPIARENQHDPSVATCRWAPNATSELLQRHLWHLHRSPLITTPKAFQPSHAPQIVQSAQGHVLRMSSGNTAMQRYSRSDANALYVNLSTALPTSQLHHFLQSRPLWSQPHLWSGSIGTVDPPTNTQ